MWFTDPGSTNAAIGRITADGAIEEFADGPNPNGSPTAIVAGPDGNLWFTDLDGSISKITTPPVATTTAALPTGPTSATVSGTANGHAQPASVHIEYGPIGGSTGSTANQPLTGDGAAPVSGELTGLQPSTTYQARVVVTNPTGTARGASVDITTPAAPAPPPPTARAAATPEAARISDHPRGADCGQARFSDRSELPRQIAEAPGRRDRELRRYRDGDNDADGPAAGGGPPCGLAVRLTAAS